MEFRSELRDLARSGAGRVQKLRYALRQLRSVLPMRLALRSPRRKSNVADRNAVGTRHTQIRRFTSSLVSSA